MKNMWKNRLARLKHDAYFKKLKAEYPYLEMKLFGKHVDRGQKQVQYRV